MLDINKLLKREILVKIVNTYILDGQLLKFQLKKIEKYIKDFKGYYKKFYFFYKYKNLINKPKLIKQIGQKIKYNLINKKLNSWYYNLYNKERSIYFE